MANRETYPASQSPLQGDISGPAGATTVTVVGIRTTPVAPISPTDQQELTFSALLGEWIPQSPGNVSIEINGLDVSDDYSFLVNCIGLDVLVGWTHGFAFQVFVDGTGVAI